MGHTNKPSLTQQVEERLRSICRFGESRHAAKRDGTDHNFIFSKSTYISYCKWNYLFVKFCLSNNYKCKTLEACKPYVDEWLTNLISHCSPYTVKLAASALAKLYGCSTRDFIQTPARYRADIKRSRGPKARDKHFSEKRHQALVDFCRSTGLRRHELAALHGTDLFEQDGVYYVHVRRGKGGKERYTPIIGNIENVVNLMRCAGEEKVFSHIPTNADIHGYRREFASALYHAYARPRDDLKHSELYFCRKDKQGVVYDRRALMIVSQALGHNRIDVVPGHYIDQIN